MKSFDDDDEDEDEEDGESEAESEDYDDEDKTAEQFEKAHFDMQNKAIADRMSVLSSVLCSDEMKVEIPIMYDDVIAFQLKNHIVINAAKLPRELSPRLIMSKGLTFHESNHRKFDYVQSVRTCKSEELGTLGFVQVEGAVKVRELMKNPMVKNAHNALDDQRIESLGTTEHPNTAPYLRAPIYEFLVKKIDAARGLEEKKKSTITAVLLTWGRKFVPKAIREGLYDDAAKMCTPAEKKILEQAIEMIDSYLTISSKDVVNLVESAEKFSKVVEKLIPELDMPPTTGYEGIYGKKEVVSEAIDTKKANQTREMVEQRLRQRIDNEKKERKQSKTQTKDKNLEDKKDKTEKPESGEKKEGKSEESKESSDKPDKPSEEEDESGEKPEDSGEDSEESESEDGEDKDNEENNEENEDSSEDTKGDDGGECGKNKDGDESGEDEGKGEDDEDGDGGEGGEGGEGEESQDGEDDSNGENDESEGDIETDEALECNTMNVIDEIRNGARLSMGMVIKEAITSDLTNIERDIVVDMRHIIETVPPPFRLTEFDNNMALALANKLKRMTMGLAPKVIFHQKRGRVHLIEAMKFKQTHNLKIFKRNLKDQTGKARMAVAILVDGSGSMGRVSSTRSKMGVAVRTCFTISKELEKLGHFVEVRGFGDRDVLIRKFRQKHADWGQDNWSKTGAGNRDTCSSITAAVKDLNNLSRSEGFETKVLMLFGDGEWNDGYWSSVPRVKQLLERANKQGVVTVFMRYEANEVKEKTAEQIEKAKLGAKVFEHVDTRKFSEELITKLIRVLTEVEKKVVKELMKWRLK